MSTKLLICLFISALLNAGAFASPISTTATPEGFDSETAIFINETLTKISNTCVTTRDREEMTGNILKNRMAWLLTDTFLFREVSEIIGKSELRSALGFSPTVPWTRREEPSDEELEAAPTIEAYYNLREPFRFFLTLEHTFLLDTYFNTAAAFLDKRVPGIRLVYRKYFEEKLGSLHGKINRAGVDFMIKQFTVINQSVYLAIVHLNHLAACYKLGIEENPCTDRDRDNF
ncbi:hypothetical protein CRE_29353 [Caenorhabditis remanei]|uniref:Uncharacterized protein n=1 Tax=Caenorhabditis remanei TaxID=31234 RepID=E3MY15_CAERE|nr:hypothetical protein CRE_29353 [Caenorhabditis remanei]